MISATEEKYLKSLLQLQFLKEKNEGVGTNELAENLHLKPATVNDMLKKLKEKNWVTYEKYGKIHLTILGKKIALEILRKHRLWETFLYEKLGFTWDEVHEVAEQLEHIQSQKLVDKIDELLDFPEVDPHGEFIPDKNGEMKTQYKKTLNDVSIGQLCKMVSVKDNTASFLQYVVKLGLGLNNFIRVISKNAFDDSLELEINSKTYQVSHRFAENIYVLCHNCELSNVCTSKACHIQ